MTDESSESRPCRAPSGLGWLLEDMGVGRLGRLHEALLEPRPWLTIAEYFELWDAIAEQAAEPTFGVRLGARAASSVLEPALLVCLGSRDLGDALERMSRYKRTLAPERLEMRPRMDRLGGIELRYTWPTADRPPPAILVEAELAFLLQLGRHATREALADARIELTRRAGDASPWTSAFGAEIRLGAETGSLRLSAAALALPFATFNPALLAALDPALAAELASRETASSDVVARIQSVLRVRLASGELSLADVADELGLSVRTLQRRLREADTSFTAMLRDVRRDRASFYLRESTMSLAEIALLVGFDSASSFHRAFVEWTGSTPGDFRGGTNGNRAGVNRECPQPIEEPG